VETQDRQHLLSPFTIRNVELRNRFVFQPHYTALGRDGQPSEALSAYYEDRAAGGVALVIVEGQAVLPSGKDSHRVVEAYNPENVPRYRSMVGAVHSHGAKMFCQLTHSGPDSLEQRPELMWGPSQMSGSARMGSTKAMELEDIAALIEGFTVSARHVREAGFDGVEVKIGHDGVLRAFASPHYNRRTDSYGGDFERRMRIIVETLAAVRGAVGPEFVMGVRLCLNEYTPWGYDAEYGLAMARHLVETAQLDYFNCDAGTALNYWMQIPPAAIPEGFFQPLNTQLKRLTTLPVIAFGRLKRPEMAEAMLAAGQADLIGMARQLIADPEMPNKVMQGREREIRYCMASNDSCIYQVALEHPIRCDHNPVAGRELLYSERNVRPAATPRTVAVIGGGPAGMKAAETLARRGHRVTIFERNKVLGGQVVLAARQPYHVEISECIDYLERELKRLEVEIHLGIEIRPEDLADLGAEVVVVATGSEPAVPGKARQLRAGASELGGCFDPTQQLPLSVLDGSNIVSVDDCMLDETRGSGRAVVVDVSGHWESVGTAEYLANRGFDVWIVTDSDVAGASLEEASRHLFYERAVEKGMHILTTAVVQSNEGGTVKVRQQLTGQVVELTDVGVLVPALGRRTQDSLYVAWKDRLADTRIYRIGDSVAPRLLRANIAEAFEFACSLE
jgi:2,4-dienoyl-CoA reductase-like NADH-dependent reductase (Old Yellow Enzyme family)/thioredoxin reductase